MAACQLMRADSQQYNSTVRSSIRACTYRYLLIWHKTTDHVAALYMFCCQRHAIIPYTNGLRAGQQAASGVCDRQARVRARDYAGFSDFRKALAVPRQSGRSRSAGLAPPTGVLDI